MKNNLIYITLLALLFLQASCIAFTKSKTKGSLSYYESFFINDSTTQFFVKPLKFESSTKDLLLVDFTFRSTNASSSKVTMNFSVISRSTMAPLQGVKIQANEKEFSVQQPKLLFKEKHKEKYLYRYNSEIDFETLKSIFGAEGSKYLIHHLKFEAGKKTQKIIYRLNSDLINFQINNE